MVTIPLYEIIGQTALLILNLGITGLGLYCMWLAFKFIRKNFDTSENK